MATQSPFSFLNGFIERIAASAQPPQWLVGEVQQRVVLFLNHVLMQEKEAMDRLVRQKGRVAQVQWRSLSMALQITPAGLLNVAPEGAVPDLRLEVTDASPVSLAQAALRGDKPSIRIEGDVQLAADINWLVDNVQWDVEEDLARLIGDVPAHTIGKFARKAAQAIRQFVGSRMASAPGASATEPASASYAAPAAPAAAAYAAPAGMASNSAAVAGSEATYSRSVAQPSTVADNGQGGAVGLPGDMGRSAS